MEASFLNLKEFAHQNNLNLREGSFNYNEWIVINIDEINYIENDQTLNGYLFNILQNYGYLTVEIKHIKLNDGKDIRVLLLNDERTELLPHIVKLINIYVKAHI